MPIPEVTEKFAGQVNEMVIGATSEQGGSRSRVVKIGGETGLPLLDFEAAYPNLPAFALEITNAGVEDWHSEAKKHVEDISGDLAKWAARCEEWGADLICLSLAGALPELGGKSPDQCADDVKRVLEATGLPLIIWGTDDNAIDNTILPKCSQASQGENCLMGTAKEGNYRTLAASALADGHKVIGEAPCDVNLSKQVNILLSDVGVDLNDIVMHMTTGALGFGMIYIYSMMERARMAGLRGDKLVQQPIIVNLGKEIRRVKEATSPQEEAPGWGSLEVRARLWEAATTANFLQSGAELFILRSPAALETAKEAAARLRPASASGNQSRKDSSSCS